MAVRPGVPGWNVPTGRSKSSTFPTSTTQYTAPTGDAPSSSPLTSQFAARPSGFVCPNAGKVQSYCDSEDPYCCKGNDANHHQQYVQYYGNQALQFVNSKLSAADDGGSTNPPPATTTGQPPTTTNPPGQNCAALWGQCGGQGWSGATCCAQGTCKASNQWYSQCQN
jgi:acetylxylan esterase